MSTLPVALGPWAEALALFAPELVEPLGELARRLDLLVGRVRTRPRPARGEPDGYAGLARRGTYERLVLSEWALAEEVPEEFDRRAASGEQAFLELDLRGKAKGARCVAFFGGGPDQLGGPRAVQVAALVVLHRRALASGAAFAWGSLHGDGPLVDAVDRASIPAFLANRHAKEPDRADVERAGERAKGAEEVWIVGGPPVGLPGVLALDLEEHVAPGARRVTARLARGGARIGEISLDLPSPAICKRILADPLRAEKPAAPPPAPRPTPAPVGWRTFPKQHRPTGAPRFALGTQQLFLPVTDGVVLRWGIDGDRVRSPKASVHALSRGSIAFGWAGGKLIEAAGDAHLVSPSWYPGHSFRWEGEPDAPPGNAVATSGVGAFTDAAGRLWIAEGVTGSRTLEQAGGDTLLLFPWDHTVFFAQRTSGGIRVGTLDARGGVAGTLGFAGDDARAGLASTSTWVVLFVASPAGLRRVTVRADPGPVFVDASTAAADPLPLPPGARLLGVGFHGGKAVPVLGLDGSIRHTGTGVTISPVNAVDPPAISADGQLAAWRTPEDHLEVWSLVRGEPALRVCPR